MAAAFNSVLISTLNDSRQFEEKPESPYNLALSQSPDVLSLNQWQMNFHVKTVSRIRVKEGFYGYLSQQQNMMQDYIRTSTYQQAMLSNIEDFKDKVILDVGAGSGILSFFAIQAGARKVYAVEASTMAVHAENLVNNNKLAGKIVVIPGKIEEINIPEPIDMIISEPMGYMLFNERMLETYLHAKKWLRPNGNMFPTKGDLHIAPFNDETLYTEQCVDFTNNSQYQFISWGCYTWTVGAPPILALPYRTAFDSSFHGVDLACLRHAAINEYFKQPVVDTFDVRICLAKSQKYTVDFLTTNESDLHVIEIPLQFELMKSGTIHGLAFWFDVAFIGKTQTIWLSTSPTEPLTHWYQVRCLLETPVFAKQGQLIQAKAVLKANKKQSYDVEIEVSLEDGTISKNTLDLKNPFFRYTGQPPQAPPGYNTSSPSDNYWLQLDQPNNQCGSIPSTGLVQQQQSQQQQQQQRVNTGIAGFNVPASSLGGGISPSLFTQQHAVVMGNTSNFPVNNSLMIGDYVTPGNIILPGQGNSNGQASSFQH
ncbi:Histone-arginine methyltransferase CARMER [Nymphon striatum]|nr:Histone-arginine methyltransferase CARMER [Nymphon striatum]